MDDDRLRIGADGYEIQSPEQKDWEKTRRGKEPRPADELRIRKALLRQALSGLSVTKGRSFKVELWIEGEKVSDGDVALHIEEADRGRREELRIRSREEGAKSQITWTYVGGDDTYEAIGEWYRSTEMIRAKDTPSKTPAEVELLGEERQRLARIERRLNERLARDLTDGKVIFRGLVDEAPPGSLTASAQAILGERIADIYDQLGSFAAQLSKSAILTLLRTDDLATVDEQLTENGIGLIRLTPDGYQVATDSGPLADAMNQVKSEMTFGHVVTGALLEKRLALPPRGAPIEVVQALVAAAMRSGLLEATYQGAKIGNPSDHRLERVFGRINEFRATSFAPPSAGPDVETRVDLAAKLGRLTGAKPPIDTAGLATALRDYFGVDSEACTRIAAALTGAEIPVPVGVTRLQNIVGAFRDADDADIVSDAARAWADLESDHATVQKLATELDDDLPVLRAAREEVRAGGIGLHEEQVRSLRDLSELLQTGDFLANRGEIKERTRAIGTARRTAAAELTNLLSDRLTEVQDEILGQFSNMGADKVADALAPIEGLRPPPEPEVASLGDLKSRMELVDTRVADVVRLLEEIQAAGNLARLSVSELVGDPITNEDELDVALARIRRAVIAELSDGKQVRLK